MRTVCLCVSVRGCGACLHTCTVLESMNADLWGRDVSVFCFAQAVAHVGMSQLNKQHITGDYYCKCVLKFKQTHSTLKINQKQLQTIYTKSKCID